MNTQHETQAQAGNSGCCGHGPTRISAGEASRDLPIEDGSCCASTTTGQPGGAHRQHKQAANHAGGCCGGQHCRA